MSEKCKTCEYEEITLGVEPCLICSENERCEDGSDHWEKKGELKDAAEKITDFILPLNYPEQNREASTKYARDVITTMHPDNSELIKIVESEKWPEGGDSKVDGQTAKLLHNTSIGKILEALKKGQPQPAIKCVECKEELPDDEQHKCEHCQDVLCLDCLENHQDTCPEGTVDRGE